MSRDFVKMLVQTIIFCLFLILVNSIFKITFTGYFILCAFALLWSVKLPRTGQIVSWSIVVVSSVLVTLNYLRPTETDGMASYNNAAHNVLALRAIESPKPLDLVNSRKPDAALFDSKDFSGHLLAEASDNGEVKLSCDITSHPVYCNQESGYRILNKSSLLGFAKTVEFKNKNGESLKLTVNDAKKKKTVYVVSTSVGDSVSVDTASFSVRIAEGYPLSNLLGSCYKDNDTREDFAERLKGVLLVRNNVPCKETISASNPLYMTVPQTLLSALEKQEISIECDGNHADVNTEKTETRILADQNVYVGIGSSKTRPIHLANVNGIIRASYDMPYMYNFPVDSAVVACHTLAVSSNADDLLSSDVKAAFFFDIFSSASNKNHFKGTITYQTSASPNALNVDIVDKKGKNAEVEHDNLGYRLSTSNNTNWIVDVVDLRKNSPITGAAFWFNDWFIVGLILALSIFALFSYNIIKNDETIHPAKANVVLNVWLFFIALITLRFYLMWRIAVFPPVDGISKGEFLLYRLENALSNNSMIWTAGTIAVMVMVTIGLYVWEKYGVRRFHTISRLNRFYSSKGFWVVLTCALGLSAVNSSKMFHLPATWVVLINVVLPVMLFFVNEWFCVRGLTLKHRIANAVAVIVMLVVGDAGYAIMFMIFECVYFIILSIVYRHGGVKIEDEACKHAVWRSSFVFFAMAVLITLFAPRIVCFLYNSTAAFGSQNVKISHIAFAVVGSLLAGAVWFVVKDVLTRKQKCWFGGISSLLVIALVVGGPIFFNYMGHFKYRSLIHTQDVGQIMEHEDVSTRNSQRLLEASQNQWFLQYHNDLGKERVSDKGLMHLYPHFKKGVSWNTQISDVICSRYIVGELSLVVPLALIILCFVLLYSAFKQENESSPGYAYAVGVALLILIQMTFVWMANTNRMIFFGQDLPFLSHNAHSTMLMFAVLLAVIMLALGNNANDDTDELSSGFQHFSRRPFQLMCVFIVIIFAFVFFTGNKYDNLYGGKAEAYTVGHAMDIAESDFQKINNVLSRYHATKPLRNKQNLKTTILPSIENEIALSQEVEKMYIDKDISEFSYSLYKSFINNNAKSNRLDNVVHLRYLKASKTYQFALNNGFYYLKAPEMDKHDWTGDIYAYQKKETFINLQNPDQGNGIYLYTIPKTWLKDQDNDYAVFYNGSDGSIKPTLFSEKGKVNVTVPTIYLAGSDVVRCTVKDKSYIYQVAGKQEDLLAKNMLINGSSRFFYPLGEKFYWVKHFADYENSNTNLSGETNCNLTIDKDLTSEVFGICKRLSLDCSVIAMDGLGNVRLLLDNGKHPNPNNAVEIEKAVENSYLNPNYTKDSRIFGNMNLLHMLPGPGSSLKPITYAAVTSQTQAIDWKSLKLYKPDEKNIVEIKTKRGTYYRYGMTKFGKYEYAPKPFISIPSDERGDNGWVNSDFYLTHSSNYYNALITYLGSFDYADFNDKNKIFKQTTLSSKEYPIVQLGGQVYALNETPDKNRHQSVLDAGLRQNFQMSVSHDDKTETKALISDNLLAPKANVSNYPWLFPQLSSVYITESRENAEAERLRKYTLGASPLKVTPIMMAEMYGRLFSMHPDYHASIIENDKSFAGQWNIEQWSPQEMFSFYQENIFGPMHHCVTGGTAALLKKVKHNGYYLYAKTGTLNSDDSGNDDKMLAVIVTDKDVADGQKVKTPEDFKFFVVYFRFKRAGGMPGEVVTVMNKIIQSKSFQDYM